MRKSVVAYCLAFISAVATIALFQFALLLCAPIIIDDFTHPENSKFGAPCGFISDLLRTQGMEMIFSLFGIIVIFLIVNFVYYTLYLSLFKKLNRS